MFEFSSGPAAVKPRSSSLPSFRPAASLTSRTAAAPCWKALVALCRNVAKFVVRFPSNGLSSLSCCGSRRRIRTAFPLTSRPA